MILFRERVWPAPWMYLATFLIVPAVVIVFAPINMAIGIISGVVIYAIILFALIASTPAITVTDAEFHAGRAMIEREWLGTVEAFAGQAAATQRGPQLDARAWSLMRGALPVVKVPVIDPDDPVPYWLVSTRRPNELAEVLNAEAQAPAV